jgi:hypothetical protein
LSKLRGITPERDDFRRIIIPLWLLQEHDVSRTPAPSPTKSERTVSRPSSVATHAPANENEQIPVLVPQAPGEEITVSLLATTAPLGYALADPLAQAPAQASILVFVSVSAAADPVADPTPQILPVLKKIGDEVPQILPRPYPVHEEIAQIAIRIAIFVAPSLS